MSIRFAEILVFSVALSLLNACGGSRKACVDPDQPYMHARSNPPLRVPEGLSKPDDSSALDIPDKASTADARPSRGGCLAEPPSYFRSSGTIARSPEEVVASWAQAWANREADAVIALYSSNFAAPTDSAGSAEWLEQRREQVATGPVPDPLIEGLKVDTADGDRRVASFTQHFGTNSLRRELTLVRESGSWRIVEEQVVEVK